MNPVTVGDLRTLANWHGSHFFSPGAMRFFNSKIDSRDVITYGPDGRGYFLTSERFESEPRLWAVRVFEIIRNGSGRITGVNIERLGDWHDTRADAETALKMAAA